MGKTKIEWTSTHHADGTVTPGSTWNPLKSRRLDTGKVGWHCEKISPACDHCYAASMNKRSDGIVGIGTGLNYAPDSRAKVEVYIDEKTLLLPLKWRKPRKIFVCSMTDVFGDWHTEWMIDRVFAVMALCPQHTFQVLTKRPERMCEYLMSRARSINFWEAAARTFGYTLQFEGLSGDLFSLVKFPLPHVWLGVTAENQEQADARIPLLLRTPAAKRFVSIEPMLGPVDLTNLTTSTATGPEQWDALDKRDAADAEPGTTSAVLDWVISGGESGPKARPSHPDWFRSLRNQCVAAGVAFFFKQWGGWVSVSEVAGAGAHFRFDDGATVRRTGKKTAGRLLDGVEWNEFPKGGAARPPTNACATW